MRGTRTVKMILINKSANGKSENAEVSEESLSCRVDTINSSNPGVTIYFLS